MPHPPASSQPGPVAAPEVRPREGLFQLLCEAIESIDLLLGGEAAEPEGGRSYERNFRGMLALLRALLAMEKPTLTPAPEPLAPLGWVHPSVEKGLDLPPGGGIETLEQLADLGLLTRTLHSHVWACPRCRRYHVNYRETCIGCGSIDIGVERLVHHFHCAYTGLESEFVQGLELHCPRCRRQLHQLGQDFDCPHDSYVCAACQRLFEDPQMQALCLACEHVFAGRDAELIKVWSYAPTPLAMRAVELNRLTGLEVSEIMYDTRVRLATRDFLELEVEREVHRARRYGGSFSGVLLGFSCGGSEFPIFREWRAESIRRLGELLTRTLRPLDLVARVDPARLALLLPETDASGVEAVERRLEALLAEAALTTPAGRALEPVWRAATWSGEQATPVAAMAFFDGAGAGP